LLLSLLLILLLWGCGNENQSGFNESQSGVPEKISVSDTETASTALTIRWHETTDQQDSSLIRAFALDCEASSVENVICTVYDASGNLLVTGDPWPCTAHSGTIEGIPVGQDRIFVVLAEDGDGNVRYQGETSGVSVDAGESTQGVVVDTYLFITDLTGPDDGAQNDSESISLGWETVQNADKYRVLVAEDIDFQSIVIDETTSATSYTPTALAGSTQYFWKVSAVDLYTNTGAESEVRSFTTSDCAYTISPASSLYTVSGGTGSINMSSDSECTWSASADAQWIEITSGTSGAGDGTVNYTVSENTGAARSAQITIAGQTHTVSQNSALPDLVITTGAPTVTPTSVVPGGNVALSSWTVSNQGHTASGSFTNGFYLSTNALITTMDVNLSDNTNTSLSPDTHFEWGGVTLVIPESTELGTYYIGILLDRTNAVTESDESNNYVRSKITVVESLDE
jgi:hypothetical protein